MSSTQPIRLIRADLDPYCDVGTNADGPERDLGEGASWVLNLDTETVTVTTHADGRVSVEGPDRSRKFLSPAAMLADPAFGDLQRWARNQELILSNRITSNPVDVRASLQAGSGSDQEVIGLQEIEEWLREPQQKRTHIVVVDGPAGIGKTTMIEQLAYNRARMFANTFAPLILHIQSAGRSLQLITDLMAAALQDIRTHVTYNQAMPLIRHGIITLVVDGFDELVDPSGYATAWLQINELVSHTRGRAKIILAGRETMVSLENIDNSLSALDADDDAADALSRLTLIDPEPDAAQAWLQCEHGWTADTFASTFIQPIFTPGSYALRPFFLAQVGPLRDQIERNVVPEQDLIVFLVNNMLRREAGKFGENIESSIEEDQRIEFVRKFLQEVARELAESQSSIISDDNLRLCAEIAASSALSDAPTLDMVSPMIARIEVAAFLTKAHAVGYRRFAHEQLSIHFLSEDCLHSIANGEMPKYVRRNLWGVEALEGFSKVARTCPMDIAGRFSTKTIEAFEKAGYGDRTRQNLAALGTIVHAVCALPNECEAPTWTEVGISELLIPPGDAPPVTFRGSTINVLHAESANLRPMTVIDTKVMTMHVDGRTVLSSGIIPNIAVHRDGRTLRADELSDRINRRKNTQSNNPEGSSEFTGGVRDLLERIERYRSFWLRDSLEGADLIGRKIVTDPDWPRVREVLRDHGRIREETRPTSGARSTFVHFIEADVRLSQDPTILSELQDR